MASNAIRCIVRFRPQNSLELANGGASVIEIDEDERTVRFDGAETPGTFTFDRAFGPATRQIDIFKDFVKGIVDDVLQGYNGTCFAYGQTGSGKTFTMMGSDIDDPVQKGIIPRIAEQIFASIMASPPNLEYLVKVSYMEIYLEKIRDLLNPIADNLQIHEDRARGVYVKGLSDLYVSSVREIFDITRLGGTARRTATTNMNAESSRSHSIFVITLQQKNLENGTMKNGNLYLVDLAGSEKVGKTGATGQTLEEAKKINKSLSALGNVINALTDGKSSHIPYRDSKLTRILQESLGGNSRTTLIVNASPSSYNEAETLSTLRFGVRAKSIKNKARINADLSIGELKLQLKKAKHECSLHERHIVNLEMELQAWRSGVRLDKEDWTNIKGLSTLASAPTTPSVMSSISYRTDLTDQVRSETPMSTLSMEKDERDEYLARENFLTDQLAERDAQIASLKKAWQGPTHIAGDPESSSRKDDAHLLLESLRHEIAEFKIQVESLGAEKIDLSVQLEKARAELDASILSDSAPPSKDRGQIRGEKVQAMVADLEMLTLERDTGFHEALHILDRVISGEREAATLTNDELQNFKVQLKMTGRKAVEGDQMLKRLNEENTALHEQIINQKEDIRGSETDVEGLDHSERKNLSIRRKDQEGVAQRTVSGTQSSSRLSTKVERLAAQLRGREQDNERLTTVLQDHRMLVEELNLIIEGSAHPHGPQDVESSNNELGRLRNSMARQWSEFDQIRRSLMRDLQDRCERVVDLEMQLEDNKEEIIILKGQLDSKKQKQKMAYLERNLTELAKIHRQLVDQNMSLRRDTALHEKKLVARNERILSLENSVMDQQDRSQKLTTHYEEQLRLLRERFEQGLKESPTRPSSSTSSYSSSAIVGFFNSFQTGRIAKPLRGHGLPGSAIDPSEKPLAPSSPGHNSPSRWFGGAK